MKRMFLYFLILCAFLSVNFTPSVYAADIDGTESQGTEGIQVTVTDSAGDTQKEDSKKEELILDGNVSINGLINTIHDGFPEVIEENQMILNVAVGTEIKPEMLPSKATVRLVYPPEMEEEGEIPAAPTADFELMWDLTELEGKPQSEGTILLTGKWGECQQNITGGAIDVETFAPVCKIIVEDSKPIQLPNTAFFYHTALNEGSPYAIKISKSARRVMIILNQKCLYGTQFSIEAIDMATQEPVLLEEKEDYHISVFQYNLSLLNLQGFFEDDKIYQIVLVQKNGDRVYRSNSMILDMTRGDLPGITLPPEGGNNDNNDNSIDVPRDGSGRGTQNRSTSEKVISISNFNALLKSGKEEIPVILDIGTLYLHKELIAHWSQEKISLEIELKRVKENSVAFRIKQNGKQTDKLDCAVKLKIPFEEKNSLIESMTPKQRENLLIVKIDGEIVPTAYFDSHSNEMILHTAHTGTLTIEEGKAAVFTDIKNHWSKSAVDFASSRRIALGYEDESFRPDQKIKGSEFTSFLMRNLPEGVINNDQRTKMYKYSKLREITRERAALIIYDALNEQLKATKPKTDFIDLKAIPAESTKAIQAVQQAGIMQGRGNNVFAGEETLSRSESLTMLINIMKAL